MEQIEYNFSIKRITKANDEDYLEALKIYNESTPADIKTKTNEITYWLAKKDKNIQFDMMIFSLYHNKSIIGFSMMTYLIKSQTVVIEYIALYDQYRVNTAFFAFINLIQSYTINKGYDVRYYIVEISNKNEGKSIDKESKFFKRLICLEGFSKINSLYYTLPLGITNHESNFVAYIYIKSNDEINQISKETYLDIVNSIYYDYFYVWYKYFLNSSNLLVYKANIDKNYQQILKSLDNMNNIQICKPKCPILVEEDTKSYGTISTKKRNRNFILFLIGFIILLCPILIVWVYNYTLTLLNIPLSSVNSMMGVIFGALTTFFITMIVSRKKL